MVSIVLFIVILVIGVGASDARLCPENQALEGAVCVDCADPYCTDCSTGSATCSICEKNHVLLSDSSCIACNKKDVACLDCYSTDGNPDNVKCKTCAEGYRLENGVCRACSSLCAECNEEECIACTKGYRKVGGNCIPCSDSMSYC